MKAYRLKGSKLFISIAAMVLIVSAFFGACNNQTSPTDQKVLKFGAVVDMRGARGLQDKKYYDLIAKLYNDEGGWKIGNDTYKVEMIIYDSQGNQTTAKDLLTRLVLDDGCKFIIGYTACGSALVDATITEPNKVISVHEDSDGKANSPELQYTYTNVSQIFSTAYSYRTGSALAAKGYKSYVSVKPDVQFGRISDPGVIEAYKMANPGMEYLETIWVDPTMVDYAPVASKIKDLNPDVVDLLYLGFIPNAVPQLYRSLYDVGYQGVILPGIMSQDALDAIVAQTGKEAVEGGMCSQYGADPRIWATDPRILSILDAYVEEYGKLEFDGVADLNMFLPLEAAINATQSVDTDVIKNYLDNSPAPVLTVYGGKMMRVARPDIGNYRTSGAIMTIPSVVIHDGKLMPGDWWLTAHDSYLFSIMQNKLEDVYKAYWDEYGYPSFPADEKKWEVLKYSDLGITGQD
jgi:branched-chain amino acid transport system substrate-binding protein